jgi:hypothetical protein
MASGRDLTGQSLRRANDDEDAARSEKRSAAMAHLRATSLQARFRVLLLLLAIPLAAFIVAQLTAGGRLSHPRALAKVAPQSATADFVLLRSAAAEPLPHAYLRAVRRAPARYALMPSGARESKDGVWLVPGHNGLCVMMADSEGHGGSCVSLAAAESKGVSFTVRDTRNGQELVRGAVPDGTVRVRALAADGATLAVAMPRSSMYRLTARNIQRISLEGNLR